MRTPGNPSAKVVPFLTGGYSTGFRGDSINGGNFGGGINYWIARRMGMRLEFRDHVFAYDGPPIHFYGFRIGWTSR